MKPSICVRAFQEADRARLQALFLVSRRTAFHWLPTGAYALDDFDRVTQGEAVLVALRGDTLLGFASVWTGTDNAAATGRVKDTFLHHLFVDPGHQGVGVGHALLGAFTAQFPGLSTLKCLTANTHATAFYRAHGWVILSTSDGPDGPFHVMGNAPAMAAMADNRELSA